MSHRIEKGTYRARGVEGSVQYGYAGANETPQVAVDLELVETSERVSTVVFFTEAAAQYAVERLRALGWEGSDLSNITGIDRNEVDVRIYYEEYEGKERMKTEIVTGSGRLVLKQTMDDRAKRAFATQFGAFAKAGASTNASAQRAPAPSSRQDDDIPF